MFFRSLVVEDDALLRSLVAREIERAGFEVAEAGSAAEAVAAARRFDPDAAILDVDLGPGPNGLVLGMRLASSSPGIAIVYLTNVAAPEVAGLRSRDLPAGAAYLRKSQVGNPAVVLAALESVLAGQDARPAHRHDLARDDPLRGLSRAQLDVLAMVAAGLTNAEIAARRESSVRAVERMIARVFAALGLDDGAGNARVRAARFYLDAKGGG